MMRDAQYHQACRLASDFDEGDLYAQPRRYKWVALPRPWYWIFTFWSTEWKNYGTFEFVDTNSPEWASAPFEIGYFFHRK